MVYIGWLIKGVVYIVLMVIIVEITLVLRHYNNYHFANGAELRTGSSYVWSRGDNTGGIFVDYSANNVHELVGSLTIKNIDHHAGWWYADQNHWPIYCCNWSWNPDVTLSQGIYCGDDVPTSYASGYCGSSH